MNVPSPVPRSVPEVVVRLIWFVPFCVFLFYAIILAWCVRGNHGVKEWISDHWGRKYE